MNIINRTMTKEKKERSPHFEFLIISAYPHLAHLQNLTCLPTNPSFAKEPNFDFSLLNKYFSFYKLADCNITNSKTS